MQTTTKSFVISCEYATCAIPEAYRELFQGVEELVTSPAGWDCGALNLAQAFATRLRTHLLHGNHTRLLLDLDRDGDESWSEYSLRIPEASRIRLADREHKAYREMIRTRIAEDLRRHDLVFHLSVRTAASEEGLIELESFVEGGVGEALAEAWSQRLRTTGLEVRHTRSAGGSGLATELADEFPPVHYGMVRLKVAQSFFLEGRPVKWEGLKKCLLEQLGPATGDVEEAVAVVLKEEMAPPPDAENSAAEIGSGAPQNSLAAAPESGKNAMDEDGQGLLF